jgi:hypothetical protein
MGMADPKEGCVSDVVWDRRDNSMPREKTIKA